MNASPCPRLRSELIASPRTGGDADSVVLKDPAAGRFFRFRETEGFILRQLDGASSLEVVRRRTEEQFDCSLSAETLQSFIENLRKHGLLEEGEEAAGSPKRRRVRGDVFYLRLKAFDPDRLLDALIRRLHFCFTPRFVVASALLILLALGLAVMHWPEISHQLRTLLRLESLLVAWVVLLTVVLLHEFAHGLTCKHFGGQVHEMGFMLIYFQPAFYCNVSDAWLFPKKAHRLWVTFAGAYFEMVLWALAMLVWRATEPHSALNHLALIVVATSAIKSLFNMNPLIKLDGYYLLSDWLDIPNLRLKSGECARAAVRALLGRSRRWPQDLAPRKRRLCVVYGLGATGFVAWLLGTIAFQAGGHLVDHYQAWGFAVFVAALSGLFRIQLKKSFRSLASAVRRVPDASVPWRNAAKRFGLGAAAIAALWLVPADLRISGEFVVLPVHNADVRAEVPGIVQEVCVDEGEAVQAGQLIARLSDRDYQSELRQVKAEIEEKQAQLKLLKAGPRAEEITLARTAVAKCEGQLKYARSRLDMDQKLFEEQVLARREFELSEELVTLRGKELEVARENLQLLLAGNRPEAIEAVAAKVSRLEIQQSHLEEQLRLVRVVSPVAGVVTTHKPREIIGQHVAKGDLIAKVHELDTVRVEISVAERDIGAVKLGQAVVLKCRAYPQETFRGTVTSIAPIATKPEEWQTGRSVLVTTQISNEHHALKPELTGNAKISCGERRLIDLLTRRLTRYLRVEFWSWW